MTNQERLEEIKEKYSKANIIEHLNGIQIIAVDKKDMDYITENSIEQSELVEKLKIELNQYRDYCAESTNFINFSILKEQNKRYREIFEQLYSFEGDVQEHSALADMLCSEVLEEEG